MVWGRGGQITADLNHLNSMRLISQIPKLSLNSLTKYFLEEQTEP